MNVLERDERALIEDLPDLHELQLIDLRIGRLLESRSALDDGSTKADQLAAAQTRLDAVNAQLSDLRGRQVDRRLERDSLMERREKDQKRLWEGMPSQTEAEALQKNLQSIAQRLDQIEIELQDLDNRIEPLEGNAEDEQRTVSELEEELADVRKHFAEEVQEIDKELDTLQKAREAQAGQVGGELLARYETIRQRRGDPGVVKVDTEVCLACNTQLTSFKMRRLQLRREVEHCENCNTILYWAGEAGPRLWLDDLRDHPDAESLFEDEDDDE